jgi:hypothetical protein
VRKGDMETPNSCDLRIFNLNPDTVNALVPVTSEFKTLTIKVGYGVNTPPELLGQIFTGGICQVRAGRESQLDTYVDITAADGDAAYNFATISATQIAANPAGIAALLQNAMSAHGVTQGSKPAFSASSALSRGRVFYGAIKDELRDFTDNVDVVWSIQDQLLTFISMTAYSQPGPPIKLTPTSGLIGTPEQTQNGVTARCLMNASLKIGSLIELEATINPLRLAVNLTSQVANTNALLLSQLSATNMYYVMCVDHTGDTRGTEWYSTLTCLSVDAKLTNIDLTGAINVAPPPKNAQGGNRIDDINLSL